MFRKRMRSRVSFTVRNLMTTVVMLALAALVCTALKPVSDSDFHVPLIFVLAVQFVSLTTDGYGWGVLASVAAVAGVNFLFTYPYFQMNFSLTGYPMTFLCMFAVSLITSTLTSRVRKGEQLRMEAERENMRANLLRAISHDLRTPLTSMIGATNAVLENSGKLSEAEKTALLTDAKNEAEWLFNMVENLLSITRIGTDAHTLLHKEPQMVEEVAGEAAGRFRKQYPDFRVEIRVPAEPLFVEMDAVLIEQVILNLLINAAIHARGATGAVLSVTERRDRVVFQVEDDGAGIRRDLLPRLFEGVAPREKSSQDGGRNMGIGLSVCQTIIKAHGGAMEAENLPERGARFRFSLPLQTQDGPEEEREEPWN